MTRRRSSQHSPHPKARIGPPAPGSAGKTWGRTRGPRVEERPGAHGPPRPVHQALRQQPSPSSAKPREGEWLWTTREGAEQDVVDELALANDKDARKIAPSLVASRRAPSVEGRLSLTFARQGFPISLVAEGASFDEVERSIEDGLGRMLAEALHAATRRAGPPRETGASSSDNSFALHVWVPDSTAANPLALRARELEERLAARIAASLGAPRVDTRDLGPGSVPLVQVCLASETRAFAGVLSSNRALSLAPGGRLRTHVAGDLPSRAARKIAEALAWSELCPEAGEVCVDLGAAPGGWTWFLLDRGARVIAVDPAKLRPDLLRRRGLTYVNRSAFEFMPDEPVDWLFCDIAFRPLEVAQMLARWARQRAATLLVANFKLPMKRKAEMVVELRKTLETGGWRAIRTRQLYHDRDEITLTARVV